MASAKPIPMRAICIGVNRARRVACRRATGSSTWTKPGDDIFGAILHLEIDATEIFAHDADRKKLNPAHEKQRQDQTSEARHFGRGVTEDAKADDPVQQKKR